MFRTENIPPLIETLSPTQQNVIRCLVEGQSVSAAARQAGVHRTTVHQWIRTLPVFRETLTILRETRANHIMDELGHLANSAINTFHHILDSDDVAAGVRLKAALEIVKLVEAHRPTEDFRESPAITQLHTDLTAVPPAAAPEPASEPAETTTEAAPKTPVRNAPCPCGSRLKYKRCCGNLAPQTRAA